MEGRTLFAAYWISLDYGSPGPLPPGNELYIKSQYDTDGDRRADKPVMASSAVEAIREAVYGQFTATHCTPGGSNEHTYTFPTDAGTGRSAAYDIDVMVDSQTGSASGGIGLETSYDDPYVDPAYYDWADVGWGVSADIIQVTSLNTTNQDDTTQHAYATPGSDGTLLYTPAETGSSTDPTFTAHLGLRASLSINSYAAAWDYVKYRLVDDGGAVALPEAGAIASFNMTNTTSSDREIEAWFDGNSNGIVDDGESVAKLLAVSTKFKVSVAPGQPNSRRVFIGSGTAEVRMAVSFYSGAGKVVVVMKNSDGETETTEEAYTGGTREDPTGLVIQGKIISVTVVANTSTVGFISQE